MYLGLWTVGLVWSLVENSPEISLDPLSKDNRGGGQTLFTFIQILFQLSQTDTEVCSEDKPWQLNLKILFA